MKQTIEQIVALVRGVWRHRWAAVGAAWGIVLGGWVTIHLTSLPYYTATSQIYVDTESVLRPLLKGLTVEIQESEQVGLMARQLMSRPNLEQVVRQTGLNRKANQTEPLDVALEKLRANITVRGERASSEARFTNFFVISYTNRDPGLAKRVVQSLIEAFSENTMAEIRRDAERAKAFIDAQIADYQEQLLRSETRLREFKREHVDVLPQGGQGYYERLRAEQAEVEGADLEIRQTESLLRSVDEQLARTPATRRAVTSDGKPVLTPLESRLAGLRAQLDELRLKYTEAHPKVVETQASIAELQRQIGQSGETVPTMTNPEYQQLSLRRKEIESNLAALHTKQEAYRKRVDELEKQIETLPLVEDELQQLTREYEANEQNYKDLVARRQSMSMSESVELDREDLRFRVIEPPNVPVDAILDAAWKKQLKLMSAVLALGFAGALGLAYALSQVRPAIYGQRALIALTGLPVYGAISYMSTFWMRTRARLGLAAFAAASLLLVVAFGAALTLQYSATYGVEVPSMNALLKPMAERR